MRSLLICGQLLLGSAMLLTASLAEAQPRFAIQATDGSKPPLVIPDKLSDDSVAATVNDEKILVKHVRRLSSHCCPIPPGTGAKLKAGDKNDCCRPALEALIDDAVYRHYLNKEVPVSVVQADFDKEWQKAQQEMKNQGVTWEKIEKQSGQTQEDVRNQIIAQLQRKVLLTRAASDERLRAYYQENKAHFDRTLVRASHILIQVKPDASKEQRQQAIDKLRAWREDILAEKTAFADIAKRHSDCPSKNDRGEIGEFTYKGVVVPEFAKAAFALKPGELSDVVRTQFGLHLILVTDRKAGKASTFEEVKDAVREMWFEDQDHFSHVIAEHRKSCKIKVHLP